MFGFPAPPRSIYSQPPYPVFPQPARSFPVTPSIYSPYTIPQVYPQQFPQQFFQPPPPPPQTHSLRGYTSRLTYNPPAQPYMSSPARQPQILSSPQRNEQLRPSGFIQPQHDPKRQLQKSALPQQQRQQQYQTQPPSSQKSGPSGPSKTPQQQQTFAPFHQEQPPQPRSVSSKYQSGKGPQPTSTKNNDKPKNMPDDLEKRFAEALQRTRNIIDRHTKQDQAKNNNQTTPKQTQNQRAQLQEDELQELALQYDDGYIYHGQGLPPQTRHGYGVLTDAENNEVYAGEWKNNHYDGRGRLNNLQQEPIDGPFDWSNMGLIGNAWAGYEGDFKEGKMEGRGVLFLTNGERYIGEFYDGMIHGEGQFHTMDSKVVKGKWEEGSYVQLLE